MTRRRIVEAAVDLHGSLGPSRTSLAAIARRAGVQRNTVYAHFPDDAALFAACSGHWYARHPPPDPEVYSAIDDSTARLRAVLGDVYAYFAANAAMVGNVMRDLEMPAVAEAAALLATRWAALRDVVVRAFAVRGACRAHLIAAVDLALAFETWRTLTQAGALPQGAACDLMACMVQGAAREECS